MLLLLLLQCMDDWFSNTVQTLSGELLLLLLLLLQYMDNSIRSIVVVVIIVAVHEQLYLVNCGCCCCSVWTIDLVVLLKHYLVNNHFTTIMLGVDKDYSKKVYIN